MEIHWANLFLLLKSLGIIVAFFGSGALIGLPIGLLYEWSDRHFSTDEASCRDWTIVIMFGTFMGCAILGVVLFALLVPLQ